MRTPIDSDTDRIIKGSGRSVLLYRSGKTIFLNKGAAARKMTGAFA